MLKHCRLKRDLSREAASSAAIENWRGPPPSRQTLTRILWILALQELGARRIQEKAVVERGFTLEDAELPDDAPALIADIRRYAGKLPSKFLKALKRTVREAVA